MHSSQLVSSCGSAWHRAEATGHKTSLSELPSLSRLKLCGMRESAKSAVCESDKNRLGRRVCHPRRLHSLVEGGPKGSPSGDVPEGYDPGWLAIATDLCILLLLATLPDPSSCPVDSVRGGGLTRAGGRQLQASGCNSHRGGYGAYVQPSRYAPLS